MRSFRLARLVHVVTWSHRQVDAAGAGGLEPLLEPANSKRPQAGPRQGQDTAINTSPAAMARQWPVLATSIPVSVTLREPTTANDSDSSLQLPATVKSLARSPASSICDPQFLELLETFHLSCRKDSAHAALHVNLSQYRRAVQAMRGFLSHRVAGGGGGVR